MILDVNKQRLEDDYVELFEITTSSTTLYYTTYHQSLILQDRDSPFTRRTYTSLPIDFSGFEHRSEGAYARPQVSFSNVLNTLPGVLGTADELLGKKITRRRTLYKYLPSDQSTPGGTESSAPTELPQQVFYFDRVTEENPNIISYELTTGFDLEGVSVPNRFIIANSCSWLYQGNAQDLDLNTATPLGACTWRTDNTLDADTDFVIMYDTANRVLLKESESGIHNNAAGAIDIDTLTPPTSAVEDKLYSRDKTVTYADTLATTTIQEYFQALNTELVTTFNIANFRRVRMYTDWNSNTIYRVYKEGRVFNPCVIYNNRVFVAVNNSQGKVPNAANSAYWERIDLCGKKLSSCAARYSARKYQYTGEGSNTVIIPYATQQTDSKVLPYGGFPAAKRYNR